MCTVSFFLNNNNEVIITSNRDEKQSRPLAIVPQAQLFNGEPLYYPKDPLAGGTWFVVNKKADVFVLLNGALEKHISIPPYRKSRGLILLELAASKNVFDAWNNINLNNIEPFTCIVYSNSNLHQFRWNAIYKENVQLDVSMPQIWSSSTLYSKEVRRKREVWFEEFVKINNSKISADDAIQFHTQTHIEDTNNGLLINREGEMLSKSVTQVVLHEKQFTFTHIDLIQKTRNSFTEKIK